MKINKWQATVLAARISSALQKKHNAKVDENIREIKAANARSFKTIGREIAKLSVDAKKFLGIYGRTGKELLDRTNSVVKYTASESYTGPFEPEILEDIVMASIDCDSLAELEKIFYTKYGVKSGK